MYLTTKEKKKKKEKRRANDGHKRQSRAVFSFVERRSRGDGDAGISGWRAVTAQLEWRIGVGDAWVPVSWGVSSRWSINNFTFQSFEYFFQQEKRMHVQTRADKKMSSYTYKLRNHSSIVYHSNYTIGTSLGTVPTCTE